MTRKYYHEGERFGRLVAIEYIKGSYYLCKCDCGKKVKVMGHDLRRGRTQSCGCLKKEQELDLVGKKFNMLTVLKRAGKTAENRYLFLCVCDCGIEKVYEGREINRGRVKSCGNHTASFVSEANTTHGDTGTRLYTIYRAMLKRCYNPKEKSYRHYGGRGIYVVDEWLGKSGYENFRAWSLTNGYKDNLTIDRIDNDGNYSPENCRWATTYQQSVNRQSTVYVEKDGIKKPLIEWCDELGLNYQSAWRRIARYNYTPLEAITVNTERISNEGGR